uniref:Uncharacterized protein n=1 Tax=Globisporangium ultimum (strain ATCC 200006 / CBS 805.95 / DAOM BR144) TaxID=431595 RepID=K3WEI4_GLOUD
MRLVVHVHGLQFTVPCGDGSQSVKWLGLVVAQRYALAAPHGRCRTREDAHLKQGFFLPALVSKTQTGEMLAPGKRIADSCKDNDAVTIHLQQEVPVNEIGSPQFAPWTLAAFASQSKNSLGLDPSSSADSKRQIASAKDATKQHADGTTSLSSRADPHKADAKSAAIHSDELLPSKAVVDDEMKEYARSELLQQVNSGQFQSEMEIEAAFLYDWSRLRIEDLEKEPKEREVIQDVLLANFGAINAAYMHYAVGSGELAYGMNGDELAHFLHECGVCNFQRDRRLLEKVVSQCLKHDSLTSLHDRGTLSRVGFLHALLRVIHANAKDNNNNSAPSFKDAIEKNLKEQIVPTATRLTAGPFRDHSHHNKMVAIFQDAKLKMLKLYAKYAQETIPMKKTLAGSPAPPAAAFTSTWPQLLSVSRLKSMLYDGGMFCAGDTKQHDEIYDNAIAQCFNGMREACLLDDQFVVFAEFIEVISRVALAVLADNDLPPQDAIKIALDAMRSLPLKAAAAPTATASSRRK